MLLQPSSQMKVEIVETASLMNGTHKNRMKAFLFHLSKSFTFDLLFHWFYLFDPDFWRRFERFETTTLMISA